MDLEHLTKSWIEEQMKSGRLMSDMAKELRCSKDVMRRRLQKFELYDLYKEMHENSHNNVVFRINNPKLLEALKKYGPLYNIVY